MCSVVLVKTAERPSRGDRFHCWEGTSKFAGQSDAASVKRRRRRGRRRRRFISGEGGEGVCLGGWVRADLNSSGGQRVYAK